KELETELLLVAEASEDRTRLAEELASAHDQLIRVGDERDRSAARAAELEEELENKTLAHTKALQEVRQAAEDLRSDLAGEQDLNSQTKSKMAETFEDRKRLSDELETARHELTAARNELVDQVKERERLAARAKELETELLLVAEASEDRPRLAEELASAHDQLTRVGDERDRSAARAAELEEELENKSLASTRALQDVQEAADGLRSDLASEQDLRNGLEIELAKESGERARLAEELEVKSIEGESRLTMLAKVFDSTRRVLVTRSGQLETAVRDKLLLESELERVRAELTLREPVTGSDEDPN
ncbi:MAG: hypothetical protein OES47_02685, partial [Acidobacteriota bacterium]|nr:hypothetical protein [Acidobacteriota bacterium]